MIVYLITNLVNGKKYVGQTHQTLAKHWSRHCWLSTSKSRMPIAMAIAKYGKENFTIQKLCDCSTQEEMDQASIRRGITLVLQNHIKTLDKHISPVTVL